MSGSTGNFAFGSQQYQSSPASQAVDNALDTAVAKVVAYLSQQPWQALVAAQDQTTGRVIINASDLAGVVAPPYKRRGRQRHEVAAQVQ